MMIMWKIEYNDNSHVPLQTYLPISLSYDHRVINGGDAGKFMVYLKHILELDND